MSISIDSPVTALSGVGPARKKLLNAMGLYTLRDLIYHFPRAYEDRASISMLSEGMDEERHAFLLTVATIPKNIMIKRGMTLTKFRAFDDSGSVEVVYYNQTYMKQVFSVGQEYRFYGKLTPVKSTFQLSSPEYEPISADTHLRPYVPVYPLSSGMSRKSMQKLVCAALKAVLPTYKDPLPLSVAETHHLPTLSFALRAAHDPTDKSELSSALRRLIFDEFFYFSLALKASNRKEQLPVAPLLSDTDVSPLTEKLPYRLTGAQERVIREILADVSRDAGNGRACPMSRIVIGDVGCGKTVCAAAALYTAVKNGHRAALMAPTEILARQHYQDIEPLFRSLGFRTELLIGSTTPKEKKRIYASLTSDGADPTDLVIGTHALISEKLEIHDLALVVADEQHRFGVMQRAAFTEKGDGAHLLVMSATPIPRTLALTLYGDLQVSQIDEMPAGRQKVQTFVVNESYRERLNAFIRKEVQSGGQVYVVCPAVDRSENDEENGDLSLLELASSRFDGLPEMKSAVALAEEMKSKTFPDLSVAFIHGKMKSAEKDNVMNAFAEGKIDILVSTTVIEVGVNVPNASLMIVENAERFGLSQLHQLRGRVGRGTRKSYCVLVSDTDGSTARARLEAMRTTYDGFAIAEKDLMIRGPGDFFADHTSEIRQSGGMSFRLSHLCEDESLMRAAFNAAEEFFRSDPSLSSPEATPVKKEIERAYNIRENTVS